MRLYKAAIIILSVISPQVIAVCENSETFTITYEGKPQNCKRLRLNEERRQVLCADDAVVLACPQSCGVCCEDNPTYSFGLAWDTTVVRQCNYLLQGNNEKDMIRTKRYCTKDNVDLRLYTWGGRSVRDACPKSCDFCFSPVVAVTDIPSNNPSSEPSVNPSTAPSENPSKSPTSSPTTTDNTPSSSPSRPPSPMPSPFPTLTPTIEPSIPPSEVPSTSPSDLPSLTPSSPPSDQPSVLPSLSPSDLPSADPSMQPSSLPSDLPSLEPSVFPSAIPSLEPSVEPSTNPSETRSFEPSGVPSMLPTNDPSALPSEMPSFLPSNIPSQSPSLEPSAGPSNLPSQIPSRTPSTLPSVMPSMMPSLEPSTEPSDQPSIMPNTMPSQDPSVYPSDVPTENPTESIKPSAVPTAKPTITGTSESPSKVPSKAPSKAPTRMPTKAPSKAPSSAPSSAPSQYCTDDTGLIINLDNGNVQNCDWLTNNRKKSKQRIESYCPRHEVKTKCRKSCEFCECIDDASFTFTLENTNPGDCAWFTDNKKKTVQRVNKYCPDEYVNDGKVGEIADRCTASCGKCPSSPIMEIPSTVEDVTTESKEQGMDDSVFHEETVDLSEPANRNIFNH